MRLLRDVALVACCAALVVFGYAIAFAQWGSGDGGASVAYVDAKVAELWAGMPLPANAAPVTDSSAAAIGSAVGRYMLQDSVRPARYRSSNCTISGGTGQCTITWSTPFSVTPNPLGDPTAINTSWSTLQFNCNWIAPGPTTTGGTVGCRTSVLGLAILGTIWSLLGNGVVVYGTAVQPL